MSIITFTGQDGTGKTTLVNELVKILNYKTFHFGPPKNMDDGKKQYYDFLKNIKDKGENHILDRFHEGEWIYSEIYRGYKGNYMREFEREITKHHNFLYVFVKAEMETIIERTRKRGEDFVKEEHFQIIQDLFNDYMNEQALPFIEIDTTNSKTSNDVKRVISAFNKVNIIWDSIRNGYCSDVIMTPALPRGNVEADVMIIAQNPGGKGKPGIHYSTTWCDVGSLSKFVLDITKETGIHRKTWYTNLVPYPTFDNKVTKEQINDTSHIIDNEINLIQPKKIITLGDISSKVISKKYGKNIEVIELPHPAYVKRFFSGNKEKIEKYKNSFNIL